MQLDPARLAEASIKSSLGQKKVLIKRLQNSRSAGEALNSLLQGHCHNAKDFMLVISTLSRRHNWLEALQVLHEMKNQIFELDVIACSSAMKAVSNAKKWAHASSLLAAAVNQGLEINVIAYTTLINAFKLGMKWKHATNTIHVMQKKQITPSLISYNCIMSACEKCQHWEAALHILQDFLQRELHPDTISYNALISAVQNSEQWERALSILFTMNSQNVVPDTISYNAVISSCSKGQQWESALDIFECMQQNSIENTVVTCNSMVTALSRGEQWERALSIFLSMQCMHLRPDIITYSSAISAYEEGRKWEEVLALIRNMYHNLIPPNVVTCNAAINAVGKCGQWQQAIHLFRLIQESQQLPDIVSFNTAIMSCATVSWHHALSLATSMRNFVLQPDAITHNTVLHSFAQCQQVDHAVSYLHGQQAEGFQPNVISFNSLLSACVTADQWFLALDVLSDMLVLRVTPDINSCTSAIYACEQLNLSEREKDIWRCLGGADLQSQFNAPLLASVANTVSVRLSLATRTQPCSKDMRNAAVRSNELFVARLQPTLVKGTPSELPSKTPYAKELSLLQYVIDTAEAGDSSSVCNAVERFGENVLSASHLWSKFAGGAKADILEAAVRTAPTGGGVLEIGTYCGYSAIRMSIALPGTYILTLEVDPIHVAVARNIITLAGLMHAIDIRTGHSNTLLPGISARYKNSGILPFSAIFMDRWGSQYHEDLLLLERHLLLGPQSVIIADNVLKTCAPLFLWQVTASKEYRTRVIPVNEFAMHSGDWMTVSSRRTSLTTLTAEMTETPEPPLELLNLHRESERMREIVFGPGRSSVPLAQRELFAKQARDCFMRAGIVPGIWLSELSLKS